jgi:hypothetical protein
MHPESARALIAQRRAEIALQMAQGRRGGRRLRFLPRWHVSWSGTTLTRDGGGSGRERSWLIVISARRTA